MKFSIFLSILLFLMSGCSDENDCKCVESLMVSIENADSRNFVVTTPNIVISGYDAVRFYFEAIDSIDWTDQSVIISQGNSTFVNVNDLTPHLVEANNSFNDIPENGTYLSFPISLFTKANDNYVIGEVDVNIHVKTVSGQMVTITGPLRFYTCEELDDDFERADCRFSWQLKLVDHQDPYFPCE